MSEPQPNPYNARKDWHNVKETEFKDSNSLFVPSPDTGPLMDPDLESATPQEDTQYKKRYDDLKKHYDNTVTTLRQELKELQAQREVQQPNYVPPKTPEEIEQYTTQHPELAKVVETMTHSQTQKLQEELEQMKEREKKILKKEAQVHLMNVHPDFETIKVDPEFHAWAETQPKNIQDWIYNNPYDGELAASAITLYKANKGIGKAIETNAPKAKQDPDAATLIPTRNSGVNATSQKKVWSRTEIKKMPMHLYEKYEDEIDQAIAEGRITR